ncbi:MAG: L-threonylcarbamoyladenylate synthase [Thermodesulfovibrionales bacterium]|nr:L-threonylcarbamoyladenylate synthase [Thermodesulfovibrionales bacterium]
MKRISIDSNNYGDVITLVSEAIKTSKIVAYPTETFYGLGVRYDDEKALQRLYFVKKRHEEKTMPLIIGDISQLEVLVESKNNVEDLLINEFWPGPLTILFRARRGLSDFIVKNGKVAVRLPSGSIARDISNHAKLPITSTSANISDMPPADDPDLVFRYFFDSIDILLDAGSTTGGKPSTIVEVGNNAVCIVRQGVLDVEGFCKRFGLGIIRKQ